MKRTVQQCVDCGSPATHTITDEIDHIFRMEQIHYSCGAILTSSNIARWQVGTVTHEGCMATATK